MSSPRTPVPHTAWTALRRDGVAIILAHPATGLPAVLHWGADLGPLEAGDLDALDLATSRQTTPGTLDAAWRLRRARGSERLVRPTGAARHPRRPSPLSALVVAGRARGFRVRAHHRD